MARFDAPSGNWIDKSGKSTAGAERYQQQVKAAINDLKKDVKNRFPSKDALNLTYTVEDTDADRKGLFSVLTRKLPAVFTKKYYGVAYAHVLKQLEGKNVNLDLIKPGDQLTLDKGKLTLKRGTTTIYENLTLFPWEDGGTVTLDPVVEAPAGRVPAPAPVIAPSPVSSPAPTPRPAPTPSSAPAPAGGASVIPVSRFMPKVGPAPVSVPAASGGGISAVVGPASVDSNPRGRGGITAGVGPAPETPKEQRKRERKERRAERQEARGVDADVATTEDEPVATSGAVTPKAAEAIRRVLAEESADAPSAAPVTTAAAQTLRARNDIEEVLDVYPAQKYLDALKEHRVFIAQGEEGLNAFKSLSKLAKDSDGTQEWEDPILSMVKPIKSVSMIVNSLEDYTDELKTRGYSEELKKKLDDLIDIVKSELKKSDYKVFLKNAQEYLHPDDVKFLKDRSFFVDLTLLKEELNQAAKLTLVDPVQVQEVLDTDKRMQIQRIIQDEFTAQGLEMKPLTFHYDSDDSLLLTVEGYEPMPGQTKSKLIEELLNDDTHVLKDWVATLLESKDTPSSRLSKRIEGLDGNLRKDFFDQIDGTYTYLGVYGETHEVLSFDGATLVLNMPLPGQVVKKKFIPVSFAFDVRPVMEVRLLGWDALAGGYKPRLEAFFKLKEAGLEGLEVDQDLREIHMKNEVKVLLDLDSDQVQFEYSKNGKIMRTVYVPVEGLSQSKVDDALKKARAV